jgi:hypothetical protein
MQKTTTFILVFIIIFVAIGKVFDAISVSNIDNCKIIKLQQQQIVSGENNSINTKIRYLIITDKETFVCENAILHGKFNNSDLFFRLKEGDTYNFKVCGVGKSFLTDYRNILKESKVE